MVTVGLYVELQAKPGKEEEVANFLREALPVVQREDQTTAWFALRVKASRNLRRVPRRGGPSHPSRWSGGCCPGGAR